MKATDKQVVIIGAGHNGLVAAYYLARAGLRVRVLERGEQIGGAVVTEELFPGHRLSTCAYFCHALQKKIIDDLELRKHGFHVYPLDPTRFHPFPNGNYIRLWHDQHRSVEEIRRISSHDAEAWLPWLDFWGRAAGLLGDFFLRPPPTLHELMAAARAKGEEDLLETLLLVPLKDLVERSFESDEMRAFTAAAGGEQIDMAAPGSALMTAYFRYSVQRPDSENVGIVKGGMGSITQAMALAATACGVSIETHREVARITVDDGAVSGVELVGGERLSGDVVVSNADPKQTFCRLVDPADLDQDFRSAIENLKTESGSLKFHGTLRELPDFSAHLGASFDPRNLAMVMVCPSLAYARASLADAASGRISRSPIIQLQIPSIYDPTLAPQGQHVVSMWAAFEPPHLHDQSWEDARDAAGEQLIAAITEYAPNFRDALTDWMILTPEDMAARVGFTDGNIRHLDMSPDQFLSRRPLSGWAEYRTPIEGLYLCGAGTHPGGDVTGAPGHNAAQAILQTLAKN